MSLGKECRTCLFGYEDEEELIHAWQVMLEVFGSQKNELVAI